MEAPGSGDGPGRNFGLLDFGNTMVSRKRADSPFQLKEYTYLDMPTGLQARDLRSFLHIVREVPDSVLKRHTMQCYLRPGFEVVDYPNEFAAWAARGLEDLPMAEALSSLDPYRAGSWSEVRSIIGEIVEGRLWGDGCGRLTPLNRAFFFQDSVNFVLETEALIWTLEDLRNALLEAANHSIYYHFHEAHQRTANPGDDFSAWIEDQLGMPDLVERIRSIDFPYYGLSELRQTIIEMVNEFLENGHGPA